MEVFFVVEKELLLLQPVKKSRARRINSAPLPCITSSFTPREEENNEKKFFFFFFFFFCFLLLLLLLFSSSSSSFVFFFFFFFLVDSLRKSRYIVTFQLSSQKMKTAQIALHASFIPRSMSAYQL